MNIKNTASKTKKKKSLALPTDVSDFEQISKKKKFSDGILFDFIPWKNNSCRFDTILALLYFISEENHSFLEIAILKDLLEELDTLFRHIRDNEFTLAQTKFIDFLLIIFLLKLLT